MPGRRRARRDSGCRWLRTLQAGWGPGIEVAANPSRQTIVIDQHSPSRGPAPRLAATVDAGGSGNARTAEPAAAAR